MTNITMLAATRPKLLKQALNSIGDLSGATVTIRDAGLSNESREVAEVWVMNQGRKTCVLHANPAEPKGTGPARNEVVRISRLCYPGGDYLYLSDDDVYFLPPDWLSAIGSCYDEAWEHGFRVLGCYNHPFNRPCAPAIRLECRWSVNEVFALASQSMLMRWEVWDEFGPFCDTPAGKVCQSEDVDFCNRIRAQGMKVGVISPPLLVNTGLTNSFGEHIPGWELVKGQCPPGIFCE